MKLSLLLIMSVVAASFAVTVDDLAARLDKVEQLAARLEAENRILHAKLSPGVPPGDDGSEADVSRRLQSSSSRASITYDGTNIVLGGGDVQVNGALNVSGHVVTGGVAFAAWAASNIAVTTSANTLYSDQFTFVSLNLGGHFDSSTGEFTAPVRGIYSITVQIQLSGSCTGGMAVMPYVNGLAYNGLGFSYFNNEYWLTRSFTSATELQAGDAVSVYMSSTSCTAYGGTDIGRTGMSGVLITAL